MVVGAPYENDRGAVYLYLGGPDGIQVQPTTVYWQRIAAADLHLPPPLDALRGFGISLSAADVDNNGYPGNATLHHLIDHHPSALTLICKLYSKSICIN